MEWVLSEAARLRALYIRHKIHIAMLAYSAVIPPISLAPPTAAPSGTAGMSDAIIDFIACMVALALTPLHEPPPR